MFLQRIELENVRSIEHLELSFKTDSDKSRIWTLLLGENGTGKSEMV